MSDKIDGDNYTQDILEVHNPGIRFKLGVILCTASSTLQLHERKLFVPLTSVRVLQNNWCEINLYGLCVAKK